MNKGRTRDLDPKRKYFWADICTFISIDLVQRSTAEPKGQQEHLASIITQGKSNCFGNLTTIQWLIFSSQALLNLVEAILVSHTQIRMFFAFRGEGDVATAREKKPWKKSL